MASAAATLDAGLAELGLVLAPSQRQALLDFADLLRRWNRVYNLTAVDDPQAIVTRHLLDSLAVQPYLHGRRLVDVGSGAGLPGIPLAIADPGIEVTLLDAAAKRVRFVRQVLIELRLGNARALQARAEAHAERYDCVVSRAFAGLSDMLTTCRQLVAPDGVILAMKGQRPGEELERLPPGFRVVAVETLAVPGLDAERHLVRFAPVPRDATA